MEQPCKITEMSERRKRMTFGCYKPMATKRNCLVSSSRMGQGETDRSLDGMMRQLGSTIEAVGNA